VRLHDALPVALMLGLAGGAAGCRLLGAPLECLGDENCPEGSCVAGLCLTVSPDGGAGPADDAGPLGDAGVEDAGPEDAGLRDAGPDDVLAGFASRRRLIVDEALVDGDADLEGFVLLVALTDPQLRSARADGADIVFTAEDGLTALPSELVAFDGDSGALTAWVRVPLLRATADTTLWMYSGSADAFEPDPGADVWSDAVAVWHLDEPGGVRRDSSALRNDLSSPIPIPGDAGGVIAGAARLPGTESMLSVSDLQQRGLDLDAPFTISFWMRPTALLSGWRNIVTKWASSADALSASNSYYVAAEATGAGYRVKVAAEDETSGSTVFYGDSIVALDAWTHVAVVWDGADVLIYVDGTLDGAAPRATSPRDSRTAFDLGNKASNAGFGFPGLLDEVRIVALPRAAEWLRAEHRNQSSPDGPERFVALGAAESL
jgi:hypothetical protein